MHNQTLLMQTPNTDRAFVSSATQSCLYFAPKGTQDSLGFWIPSLGFQVPSRIKFTLLGDVHFNCTLGSSANLPNVRDDLVR